MPTGSDRTAYAVLGCTNLAGGASENHELQETLPGLGTASEDQTRVWTTQRHGVVSTYSRNTIAQVDVAGSPLGSLQLNGILALSRAFHDRSGFHATNRASVASITFTPAGGQPQPVDLPAPGQPVEVPGVATLSVGGGSPQCRRRRRQRQHRHAADRPHGHGDDDDGRARGGRHPPRRRHRGLRRLPSGTRGKAADGTVTSGRTPNLVMPCQGTGGHVRTRSVTQTRLTGGLLVQGLATRQLADQNARRAHGYEQARIAGIDLGNGRLEVAGIVGRVNVERLRNGTLRRNTSGTTLGTITVNGRTETIPASGVLEVPGVAKLERNVVDKIANGLHVVSLRVTLLDGSGAVFELGEASLRISRSGL